MEPYSWTAYNQHYSRLGSGSGGLPTSSLLAQSSQLYDHQILDHGSSQQIIHGLSSGISTPSPLPQRGIGMNYSQSLHHSVSPYIDSINSLQSAYNQSVIASPNQGSLKNAPGGVNVNSGSLFKAVAPKGVDGELGNPPGIGYPMGGGRGLPPSQESPPKSWGLANFIPPPSSPFGMLPHEVGVNKERFDVTGIGRNVSVSDTHRTRVVVERNPYLEQEVPHGYQMKMALSGNTHTTTSYSRPEPVTSSASYNLHLQNPYDSSEAQRLYSSINTQASMSPDVRLVQSLQNDYRKAQITESYISQSESFPLTTSSPVDVNIQSRSSTSSVITRGGSYPSLEACGPDHNDVGYQQSSLQNRGRETHFLQSPKTKHQLDFEDMIASQQPSHSMANNNLGQMGMCNPNYATYTNASTTYVSSNMSASLSSQTDSDCHSVLPTSLGSENVDFTSSVNVDQIDSMLNSLQELAEISSNQEKVPVQQNGNESGSLCEDSEPITSVTPVMSDTPPLPQREESSHGISVIIEPKTKLKLKNRNRKFGRKHLLQEPISPASVDSVPMVSDNLISQPLSQQHTPPTPPPSSHQPSLQSSHQSQDSPISLAPLPRHKRVAHKKFTHAAILESYAQAQAVVQHMTETLDSQGIHQPPADVNVSLTSSLSPQSTHEAYQTITTPISPPVESPPLHHALSIEPPINNYPDSPSISSSSPLEPTDLSMSSRRDEEELSRIHQQEQDHQPPPLPLQQPTVTHQPQTLLLHQEETLSHPLPPSPPPPLTSPPPQLIIPSQPLKSPPQQISPPQQLSSPPQQLASPLQQLSSPVQLSSPPQQLASPTSSQFPTPQSPVEQSLSKKSPPALPLKVLPTIEEDLGFLAELPPVIGKGDLLVKEISKQNSVTSKSINNNRSSFQDSFLSFLQGNKQPSLTNVAGCSVKRSLALQSSLGRSSTNSNLRYSPRKNQLSISPVINTHALDKLNAISLHRRGLSIGSPENVPSHDLSQKNSFPSDLNSKQSKTSNLELNFSSDEDNKLLHSQVLLKNELNALSHRKIHKSGNINHSLRKEDSGETNALINENDSSDTEELEQRNSTISPASDPEGLEDIIEEKSRDLSYKEISQPQLQRRVGSVRRAKQKLEQKRMKRLKRLKAKRGEPIEEVKSQSSDSSSEFLEEEDSDIEKEYDSDKDPAWMPFERQEEKPFPGSCSDDEGGRKKPGRGKKRPRSVSGRTKGSLENKLKKGDDSEIEFSARRKGRRKSAKSSSEQSSTSPATGPPEDKKERTRKNSRRGRQSVKPTTFRKGIIDLEELIDEGAEKPNSPSLPGRKLEPGDFVILKCDIGNPEAPIWMIDGKSLLQKFQPFQDNGKTLYRSSSTYSGWGSGTIDNYLPVKNLKKGSHCRSVSTELSEIIKIEDTEDSKTASSVDPKSAEQKKEIEPLTVRKNTFDVYLQILISHVLDSRFIKEFLKEKDEYFTARMKEVDLVIHENSESFCKKLPWTQSFVEVMQCRPLIKIMNFNKSAAEPCQSCGAPKSSVNKQVRLFGQPYDLETLENNTDITECKSGENNGAKKPAYKAFKVCSSCSDACNLCHSLRHLKLGLSQKCQEKVSSIRGDKPGLENSVIMDKCLGDRGWVEKLYQEVIDLWSRCNQYPQSSNHK